tara:strand:- start:903 stop:1289 length:387 start_codon:yes stop_codon:yes gene_type:complete
MSTKLNENQLIAIHLLASGVKASVVAKELGIREETLSRWRQIDEFQKSLDNTTEVILREIVETHKNLLISSQSIIYDALHNEELDIFKKANLALRFLSLMKGKDDIFQKDTEKLRKHLDYKEFNFGII